MAENRTDMAKERDTKFVGGHLPTRLWQALRIESVSKNRTMASILQEALGNWLMRHATGIAPGEVPGLLDIDTDLLEMTEVDEDFEEDDSPFDEVDLGTVAGDDLEHGADLIIVDTSKS